MPDNKEKKPENNKKKKRGAEAKPQEPVESYDSNFWSIILLAVTMLITLVTLVEGTAGWLALHNFVRGLFGISIFIAVPVLFYASYIISKEKTKEAIVPRFIQGGILLLLASSVIQVVFIGDIPGEDLDEKLALLYSDGIHMESGGVLSALIGVPLVTILGNVGAKITILLAIFIIILFISNMSVEKLFNNIKRPYNWGKEQMDKFKEDSVSRRYEREVKETSKYELEDAKNSKVTEIKIQDKKNTDSSKKEPVPLLEREVNFEEIKNIFKKKSKQDKKSQELAKILDEKTNDLSFEKTITNTIDIPIITDEMSSKYRSDKNDSDKTSDFPADTSEKTEDSLSPQRRPIDLNKKPDTFNNTSEKKYNFPPIDFLKPGSSAADDASAQVEMQDTAIKLVQTLENFGVKTTLVDVHRGPTVTRYELQPSPGVKISRITGLADDIALNLAAAGVRIEAPIPGKAAVGIEVPNVKKDTVSLREMLESDDFKNSGSKLSFAVGRDIAGQEIIGDIAKMPHVIIAGATGSGKSVCTNSIIMSILYKATPDEVRLLLIDPKIVEFKVYDGIPHLLIPVVTDPRKAAGALNWAVQEMLRRYKLFADNNVRDLKGYNEMASESGGIVEPIPQIVIAIDELADLMMAASNEVEDAICRLAQMARAAGMHLIIATQRPTVDIITGLIKANIPSRIALSVMSQTDSRTILDTGGADKLLGQGDMLYFPSGIPKPIRVQGCFCSTKEIESVVSFIKNNAVVDYSNEIMEEIEKNIPVPKGEKAAGKMDGAIDSDDELVEKAIDIIIEMGQASTSSLQRKLKLGYARAARIMDELEQLGVIGPSEGSKPRKILMTKSQWTERRMRRFDESEDE
ncbi:MAG: DNA translocase FtsK [Ruminococcus sp.]|nr:DNA translocase FtsK [Ruminococcus sp.]